jgi:hypothetical protein
MSKADPHDVITELPDGRVQVYCAELDHTYVFPRLIAVAAGIIRRDEP